MDKRLAALRPEELAHDCGVEHVLFDRAFKVMAKVEQTLVQKLSETTILEIGESAD